MELQCFEGAIGLHIRMLTGVVTAAVPIERIEDKWSAIFIHDSLWSTVQDD